MANRRSCYSQTFKELQVSNLKTEYNYFLLQDVFRIRVSKIIERDLDPFYFNSDPLNVANREKPNENDLKVTFTITMAKLKNKKVHLIITNIEKVDQM